MEEIEEETFVDEVMFPGDILDQLSPEDSVKYPYNCIGVLKFNYNKNVVYGTGFLIAPDLVLTVAHNLYNRKEMTEYTNFMFYAGANGQLDNTGSKVEAYRYHQEFKMAPGLEEKNYDYALLRLEDKIKRDKYLPLQVSYKLVQEEMQIHGYNQKACFFQYQKNQALMVGMKKPNTKFQQNSIFLWHDISTMKGNSGSPLVAYKNEEAVIASIHQAYQDSKKLHISRIITPDVVQSIAKWKKEMDRGVTISKEGKIVNIDDWLISQQLARLTTLQRQQILKYQQILNSAISVHPPFVWEWDNTSIHANKFNNLGPIAKLTQGNEYQIVSCPLPFKGTHAANIQVHYQCEMIIGLITRSRKAERWSDGEFNNLTLSYKTDQFGGVISMEKNSIVSWSSDLFIAYGGVLRVEVNVESQTVIFKNLGANNEHEVKLTENFAGKQLYLFVAMYGHGDSATFI